MGGGGERDGRGGGFSVSSFIPNKRNKWFGITFLKEKTFRPNPTHSSFLQVRGLLVNTEKNSGFISRVGETENLVFFKNSNLATNQALVENFEEKHFCKNQNM